MKHKNLTKLAVLGALLALLLVASPVLAFLFRAPLTIAESAGTAYTQLAVGAAVNNKYLSTNGFMDADARDTKVGTLGGSAYPHMVSDSFTWTATALPANGQVNLYLTTGETPADFDIVLGNGGTFTVKDAAALELGSDFESEWSGYVPASSTDTILVDKTGSFLTTTGPVSGDVTSYILTSSGTVDILPDGAGDLTDVPTQFPAATSHYDKVDDPVGAPDDATTYVSYTFSGAGQKTDLYQMQNPVRTGAISFVTVFYRSMEDLNNATPDTAPVLKLGGVTVTGTYTDASFTNYSDQSAAMARPGGGSWTWDDIDDLQAGVSIDPANTFTNYVTQVYIRVTYSTVSVTAAGVTDEEHVVKTTADGANLKIYVDGVEEDSVAIAAIPDTANDWVLTPSPWWSYYKHTVGGTLIAHFQPQDIIRGAVYSTGTVTVTNGDATVEGAGGATWTDAHDGGVFVSADGAYYVIDSITDADTLELTAVYGGGTLGAQTYNFYPRLPDRQGTAQDGRITFGSNPAGVTAVLGGLVSGAQSDPGGSVGGGSSRDLIPGTPAGDEVWGDGTVVSATLQTNPFRGFIQMVSDHSTMTELEVWRIVGGALILLCFMAVVRRVKGHHILTGIAVSIGIGANVVMGIYGIWFLALWIPTILVSLLFHRTPSVT
jgi:hypothetical protein